MQNLGRFFAAALCAAGVIIILVPNSYSAEFEFIQTTPTFDLYGGQPLAVSRDGKSLLMEFADPNFVTPDGSQNIPFDEIPLPWALETYPPARLISDQNKVVFGSQQWTPEGGVQELFDDHHYQQNFVAAGMSSDGAVIAGTLAGHSIVRLSENGEPQILPPADFLQTTYQAYGISADGNVIVGRAGVWPRASAFRWTPEAGSQLLNLPYEGYATAVSGDGNVIVGTTTEGPFRWTESGGAQMLGVLPESAYPATEPTGISEDGSVVVGLGYNGDDPSNPYLSAPLWIWTEEHGLRNLKTVLVENYGLGDVLGEGVLNESAFVSDDGRTIIGMYFTGVHSFEGQKTFRVTLNLPGDANDDGQVDGIDYIAWESHFKAETKLFSEGDFNSDGIVDGRDYIIWAENYTGSEPFSAFPVPEPSTIMLGVVGALACLAMNRCRRA